MNRLGVAIRTEWGCDDRGTGSLGAVAMHVLVPCRCMAAPYMMRTSSLLVLRGAHCDVMVSPAMYTQLSTIHEHPACRVHGNPSPPLDTQSSSLSFIRSHHHRRLHAAGIPHRGPVYDALHISPLAAECDMAISRASGPRASPTPRLPPTAERRMLWRALKRTAKVWLLPSDG